MATEVKAVRDPQPKKVIVTVAGNDVILSDDPVRLKEGAEEVMWRCNDGDLEIRFRTNDTPFNGHHYKSGKRGGCCSGEPRSGTVRSEPYKYTVIVTVGGHSYEKDPDVIVTR